MKGILLVLVRRQIRSCSAGRTAYGEELDPTSKSGCRKGAKESVTETLRYVRGWGDLLKALRDSRTFQTSSCWNLLDTSSCLVGIASRALT